MNNPLGFKRADHIHITVPPEKLEEAKIFYTQMVGLELIERPDHLFNSSGYWFDIADIQLHIGIEPATNPSTRHTAFEVENIAVALKILENRVFIIEEPVIPGRKRFAFLDPFGNRIELLQII